MFYSQQKLLPLYIFIKLGNMQGFNNSRLFRISSLKVKGQNLHQHAKGISMHIYAPILKQYKSIDLSKSKNTRRIRHKTTYESQDREEVELEKLVTGKNWENIIGDYIGAKERIVNRKGELNSFQFLKLNKAHKNLYKRLVKRQSLPQQYMKKTLSETFVQNIPQRYTTKHNKQHIIKAKTTFSQSHNRSINEPSIYQEAEDHFYPNEKESEDKILNHFLSKYFKKKYRRESSDRREINRDYKVQYKMRPKSRGKVRNNLGIKDQFYRTNTN